MPRFRPFRPGLRRPFLRRRVIVGPVAPVAPVVIRPAVPVVKPLWSAQSFAGQPFMGYIGQEQDITEFAALMRRMHKGFHEDELEAQQAAASQIQAAESEAAQAEADYASAEQSAVNEIIANGVVIGNVEAESVTDIPTGEEAVFSIFYRADGRLISRRRVARQAKKTATDMRRELKRAEVIDRQGDRMARRALRYSPEERRAIREAEAIDREGDRMARRALNKLEARPSPDILTEIATNDFGEGPHMPIEGLVTIGNIYGR